MNGDEIKVILCSREIGGGRIDVELNGEQVKEVDCFKYYLHQQITEDVS